MKRATIIVDLQFGSCGKGLLAGYLAKRNEPDTLVTAWGPNAGHTFIDSSGNKMVTTMIPNGVVSPKLERILIGPGSVINPVAMIAEMEAMAAFMPTNVDLLIHEHAAVVMDSHRGAEASYSYKIGSTMKGVGEAVIQKIKRDPDDMNVARVALKNTPLEGCVVSVDEYNFAMDAAEILQVEGSQGFSLGINNGFYPYTTSRECTVSQIMSDCAIPLKMFKTTVIGAARTYPIRVANRFKDGVQIGWSGPCYPDQRELVWGDIGREPELTTVTKLPRRLFDFSENQIEQAIRMNGTDAVFLNFANYFNNGSGEQMDQLRYIIATIGKYAPVTFLGWGATEDDIEELV